MPSAAVRALPGIGAMLLAGIGMATAGNAGSRPTPAITFPDVAPAVMSRQVVEGIVRTLSSDSFEGRAAGTAGGEKTTAYLVQRFIDAGLQPGNSGAWLQNVPMVEITGQEHGPLIVSAHGHPLRFDFGTDWVGVTSRPVKRIDLKASELVFVGFGINAPEKGWNDYAGMDMRGKTALILANDPDHDAKSGKGPFGGRAMSYYGRWTYKFEEAARQGAAAAIIIHDASPGSNDWNEIEGGWTGPQTYLDAAHNDSEPMLMSGWVQKSVAEQMATAAGKDMPSLGIAAQQRGFRAVALGITISTGFDNTVRRMMSHNVIGVLPGKARAREYVLYTAHWDHLGRCPADETGDDICNGAIDNATGTAGLVALAAANTAAGPAARSQVFIAFTGEEEGLLGSEFYATHPIFPLEQTAGGLNIDTMLMTGTARDMIVVGKGKSNLDAYLAKALRGARRRPSPDPAPEDGHYYRSDHFSFARRGVPMLYIESGQNLVSGGRKAGRTAARDYETRHYHQPSDEYDPNWDWAGVMEDLQILYQTGRMLAQSKAWPNWHAEDEFRPVRDESCAASPDGC
ncbi:MAG: M28 family peptidase [Novosphingobium sp.]